jgi:hypothetical protein
MERITKTVNLADYSLAAPSHTITLFTTKGEHTIKAGAKSFDDANYYVLRDSDSIVYLVQALTIDELKKMLTEPIIAPTPTSTPTATAVVGPQPPTGTPGATGSAAPPVGTPAASATP